MKLGFPSLAGGYDIIIPFRPSFSLFPSPKRKEGMKETRKEFKRKRGRFIVSKNLNYKRRPTISKTTIFSYPSLRPS